MSKRIAVVVRDRQEEALRMSIGLTLMDDTVDVYLLNRRLPASDGVTLNLETLREMELKLYSNVEEEGKAEYLPTQEIARKLSGYDQVLPF